MAGDERAVWPRANEIARGNAEADPRAEQAHGLKYITPLAPDIKTLGKWMLALASDPMRQIINWADKIKEL